MSERDEGYEAFLAREAADDWRERAEVEAEMIGKLNGELNNLNHENSVLRKMLHLAIVELHYVHESPTLELTRSAAGYMIIAEGMKLLKLKDLSAGALPDLKRTVE